MLESHHEAACSFLFEAVEVLLLLFWQTFPRASECSYALLHLQHPPVTCFAAHTRSLSHVPSLLPAVASMSTADLSAALSPPRCRGCGAGRSPPPSLPARTDAQAALRHLFGKRSGLLSEGGRLLPAALLACAGLGGTASLLPASLQWPRPQPPRRAARPAGPGPPATLSRRGLVGFFFFGVFFFFLFPFSCSETFSYVHFSPVELIYELGLARAGVAGPSAGRAARGRGAPAGLPSRGSARLPARHEL